MELKNFEKREKIYQELRSRIFSGKYPYGQRLIEVTLASEFSVNKSHIRQVLLRLKSDSLVEHIHMKGFFVKGISPEALYEIAKIRKILENEIFEDFLTNASSEDVEIAKLFTKRKIALLKSGLKEEAFKETAATFDRIYSATSYHRMVEMLRQYQEYIDLMIIKAFDSPDDVEKTIQNSTLLFQVLDKRDITLAREWIEIRYNNAVSKIRDTVIGNEVK